VANADAIKGAAGENLKQALDWLPIGRQLLTIKTDCDLDGYVDGLPDIFVLRPGVTEPEDETGDQAQGGQ
jgi:DNA polymerase-1